MRSRCPRHHPDLWRSQSAPQARHLLHQRNVHNPWDFTVEYFTKYAAAGDSGNGGVVGPWNTINSNSTRSHSTTPLTSLRIQFLQLHEGYFVIECSYELDVVGVYRGPCWTAVWRR